MVGVIECSEEEEDEVRKSSGKRSGIVFRVRRGGDSVM
jgi:hypothetical protein